MVCSGGTVNDDDTSKQQFIVLYVSILNINV